MDEILFSYVNVAGLAKGSVPLKVQLRVTWKRWVFWPYGEVKTTVWQREAIFSVAVVECIQQYQGLD